MSGNSSFKGTGKRLIQLREELGLTVSQMAKRLDVAHSTYYRNEKGDNTPDVATLKKLAAKDDIALDWFLMERGPKCFGKERKRVEAMEQKLELLEKEKKEWLRIDAEYKENEKHLQTKLEELKNRRREELEEMKSHIQTKTREQMEADLRRELEIEIREETERRVTEAHEKKLAEGTALIFSRLEIKDLLVHMERAPLLYYEIMVHFENFRLQHRDLLEKTES